MTPLIQAPSIIPQLILSLCTISIATCNKLFEINSLLIGIKLDLDYWSKWEIKLSRGYLIWGLLLPA
jgi:hypothetical protein